MSILNMCNVKKKSYFYFSQVMFHKLSLSIAILTVHYSFSISLNAIRESFVSYHLQYNLCDTTYNNIFTDIIMVIDDS